MKITIFLMVCAAFGSCAQPEKKDKKVSSFEIVDGLYLVEGTSPVESMATPTGREKVVHYNYRFVDSLGPTERYILINTGSFVPLTLKSRPGKIVRSDGRSDLVLELSSDAKKKLKVFTLKNLHRKAAIVVDGEAVTLHKVRSVIDEGYLQINRCTDDACKHLFIELQDNIPEIK